MRREWWCVLPAAHRVCLFYRVNLAMPRDFCDAARISRCLQLLRCRMIFRCRVNFAMPSRCRMNFPMPREFRDAFMMPREFRDAAWISRCLFSPCRDTNAAWISRCRVNFSMQCLGFSWIGGAFFDWRVIRCTAMKRRLSGEPERFPKLKQ